MGLKELKEQYPILGDVTAAPHLLGFPAYMSPFAEKTSSARLGMFSSHLNQGQVIVGAEFPHCFTGFEDDYGTYAFNSTARKDMIEVLEVIPKYRDVQTPQGIATNPLRTVIFRNESTGEIDCFDIKRYFQGTSGFGFEYQMVNDNLVRPGNHIPPETVIAQSPSFKNGHYCYGTNLNTLYLTSPETLEDSIIISESAAAKLETIEIHKIVINIKQADRPLNLYGDENMMRLIPDIGMTVNKEGILCAFRGVSTTTCAADTDPEVITTVQNMGDTLYYVKPGTRVVDVDFIYQKQRLTSQYHQAVQYKEHAQKYWENILRTYANLKQAAHQKFKLTGNPAHQLRITAKFDELVSMALRRLIAMGGQVPPEFQVNNTEMLGENNQVVEFVQMVITVAVPHKVQPGSKLSDRQGSKGVVSAIIPDHMMPVDDYGFVAHVIIASNSPVSRMNMGQLYEPDINRIAEFVRRRVEAEYKSGNPLVAFNTLYEWYKDISPETAKLTIEDFTSDAKKAAHVRFVIQNGVFNHILPYSANITHLNVDRWGEKWNAPLSAVTFKILDEAGELKTVRTVEDDMSIGGKYTLFLCKRPEATSAGVGYVSHHAIPTKPGSSARLQSPVKMTPVKILGEDEGRLARSGCRAEAVVRLMNLNANSLRCGVEKVVQTIATHPNPTTIGRIDVSNEDLANSCAPTSIYHYETSALGLETRQTVATDIPPPDLKYAEDVLQVNKASMSDLPGNDSEED